MINRIFRQISFRQGKARRGQLSLIFLLLCALVLAACDNSPSATLTPAVLANSTPTAEITSRPATSPTLPFTATSRAGSVADNSFPLLRLDNNLSSPANFLLGQGGNTKYYRYNQAQNKVDSLPDYNDDPKQEARNNISRFGYISPDRKKAVILADSSQGNSVLWITDLTTKLPETILSYDLKDISLTKLEPHWNSSSDGLVFRAIGKDANDAGNIFIFSLAKKIPELISSNPGCSYLMSWSTVKNEIYCLLVDQNKLGVISVLTKTSKTVATPALEKAKLSSNGEYLVSGNSVYAVDDLTKAGANLPSSRYVSPAEVSSCVVSSGSNNSAECTVWSSDGRFVGFYWTKNQVERMIDVYDTSLKKSYRYKFRLPFNNLTESNLAIVLDQKQVMLSCKFGNDSNNYYQLVNLEAATYIQKTLDSPQNHYLQ